MVLKNIHHARIRLCPAREQKEGCGLFCCEPRAKVMCRIQTHQCTSLVVDFFFKRFSETLVSILATMRISPDRCPRQWIRVFRKIHENADSDVSPPKTGERTQGRRWWSQLHCLNQTPIEEDKKMVWRTMPHTKKTKYSQNRYRYVFLWFYVLQPNSRKLQVFCIPNNTQAAST